MHGITSLLCRSLVLADVLGFFLLAWLALTRLGLPSAAWS